MSKPDLTVVGGDGVKLVEHPHRVDFKCWSCGLPCVMHPNHGNATLHGLPVCAEWTKIEAKKEDVERFLIKSGVHMLTKQPDDGS